MKKLAAIALIVTLSAALSAPALAGDGRTPNVEPITEDDVR